MHLVKPLGFELDNAKLKRAGLDYRQLATVRVYDSFSIFAQEHEHARKFIFSKWHKRTYTDVGFIPDDYFIFGSETRGLPARIRDSVNECNQLTLPMLPQNRSLNLSNSVAIVVYEAWRQNKFAMRKVVKD